MSVKSNKSTEKISKHTLRPNSANLRELHIHAKTGILQFTGSVPKKSQILQSIKGEKSREAQIIRSTYKKSK